MTNRYATVLALSSVLLLAVIPGAEVAEAFSGSNPNIMPMRTIRRVGNQGERPSRRGLVQSVYERAPGGTSFEKYREHLRRVQQERTQRAAERQDRRGPVESVGEEKDPRRYRNFGRSGTRHLRRSERRQLSEDRELMRLKQELHKCARVSRTRRARCYYQLQGDEQPES